MQTNRFILGLESGRSSFDAHPITQPRIGNDPLTEWKSEEDGGKEKHSHPEINIFNVQSQTRFSERRVNEYFQKKF